MRMGAQRTSAQCEASFKRRGRRAAWKRLPRVCFDLTAGGGSGIFEWSLEKIKIIIIIVVVVVVVFVPVSVVS